MFLLVLLVAGAAAVDLAHKDCGSSATITRAWSDECDSAVCKLKKGNTYHISISYKPVGDIAEMSAKLYGVIAGIPVPFPLPVADGCVACGNTCPIKAGTEVTFTEALKVEPAYPALRLTSRWKLEAKGNHVLCVEIPVVIVS